jgi:hypothetical protein
MKRDQLRKSSNDQAACQFSDAAANDNVNESALQDYESSAGVYESRLKLRTRVDKELLHETWWIIIALYLVLISVGFVAL